jgi:hypothetical protein
MREKETKFQTHCFIQGREWERRHLGEEDKHCVKEKDQHFPDLKVPKQCSPAHILEVYLNLVKLPEAKKKKKVKCY